MGAFWDRIKCPNCKERLQQKPRLLSWIGEYCIYCGWTDKPFDNEVKDADDSSFVESGWYDE